MRRVPFVCIRCSGAEQAIDVLQLVETRGLAAERYGREVRVYPEDITAYDLRFVRDVKHADIFEVRV